MTDEANAVPTIVEWLRLWALNPNPSGPPAFVRGVFQDAATEIERLTAELAEARATTARLTHTVATRDIQLAAAERKGSCW